MIACERKVVSLLGFLPVVSFFLLMSFGVVKADVIFEDKLDSWGDWWADNGVWDVGTPTSGPEGCRSGSSCAGTVLGGNYPSYTDSRFISPSVQLPQVLGSEEIHLWVWHWFSYSTYDAGYIEISTYDQNTGEWSDWGQLGGAIVNNSSWSRTGRDLTGYSGKKIRVAFTHTAHRDSGNSSVSSGWYIDDITITGPAPVCPQATYDTVTGRIRIPCLLADGLQEYQFDVELEPPYKVKSVTAK